MSQLPNPSVIDQCDTCGEAVSEEDVGIGLCPFCHQPLGRRKLMAD